MALANQPIIVNVMTEITSNLAKLRCPLRRIIAHVIEDSRCRSRCILPFPALIEPIQPIPNAYRLVNVDGAGDGGVPRPIKQQLVILPHFLIVERFRCVLKPFPKFLEEIGGKTDDPSLHVQNRFIVGPAVVGHEIDEGRIVLEYGDAGEGIPGDEGDLLRRAGREQGNGRLRGASRGDV
jgi:hypothetical protein